MFTKLFLLLITFPDSDLILVWDNIIIQNLNLFQVFINYREESNFCRYDCRAYIVIIDKHILLQLKFWIFGRDFMNWSVELFIPRSENHI